jgi:hypothetical protein
MASATSDEVNPRFTVNDVDDPNVILRPIEGYQNTDKLSLEEASKPIASHFRNLKRDVWLSKQATEALKDYLSHDESAAIYLYTTEIEPQSLYTVLNELLRAKDRKKLKPWFPYLNLVLTALFKMPSVTTIVWREVKAKLHHLYEKGKFYIWWSFTSCTLSVELLENPMYLGDSGERTLFSIECFSGKAIKNYSYYQYEDEILLLPGTYLEVTGKAKIGDGFYIIRMRDVKPPHVLLEPPIGFEQVQNIEFILDSVYEANRENDDVPKLFIILPDPLHPWDRVDFEKNKFLLHFICECSTDEIHFAHYPGYAIPHPRQFLGYYNRYIQQFMIPLATHLFHCRRMDSIHNDEFWDKFMQGVSEVQEILKKLQSNVSNPDITLLDTQELPDFLLPFQRKASNLVAHGYFPMDNYNQKLFSNLCRSIAMDMVVRWVCTEHYPVDQLETLYRLKVVGGYFDPFSCSLKFYYNFKNMNSIRLLNNVLHLHTRCYYLHLRISIDKSIIHLFDEIIEILCRISCLSLGSVHVMVEDFPRANRLADELLRRFIESNVHTKHISDLLRFSREIEQMIEVSIATSTLHTLFLYAQNSLKVLQERSSLQRLLPNLSSLSVHTREFSGIVSNLCDLIRSSKKLRYLHLWDENNNHIDTSDLQQLCDAVCANDIIKKLHINFRMTDIQAPLLTNVIRSCPNLMSLTLEQTHLTAHGVNYIMNESGKSNSLLFLYFKFSNFDKWENYCSKNINYGFPVARCLTAKSLLVTYSVSTVGLDNDEIGGLVENLKTNIMLSHLSLCNVLTTKQAECILNALCLNTSLISLDLSVTPIGLTEATIIGEMLQSKTNALRMLYLRNCDLTDKVVCPLITALIKNRRITHLDLKENNMGDESANRIAAVIAVNVSLTCLNVKDNKKWTVDGLVHIARSLVRNSTLTEFYFGPLNRMDIKDRAVKAFYKALGENTTIVRSSEHYNVEELENLLLVKRPNLILA